MVVRPCTAEVGGRRTRLRLVAGLSIVGSPLEEVVAVAVLVADHHRSPAGEEVVAAVAGTLRLQIQAAVAGEAGRPHH